jgi:hypothetical protein
MTTIGDSISRMRNALKAVKEDPFITDRYIYSVINKYAKLLIRRQDNENKIMRFQSLFEPLPCVDLIEVSKIEACCAAVSGKCTIMRTKDRLPTLLEGVYGPLFRSVTSLDGSVQVFKTYPTTYTAMSKTTNFKYNKKRYYWYLDGYLYFPNLEWDQIRVEALWEGSTFGLNCKSEDECTMPQDRNFPIPEYLFAEIEQYALKEFLATGQIMTDGPDDKQNVLR